MIRLQNSGHRLEFIGKTYPARDVLRAGGCTWDPATKSWWLPSDQAAQAQAILDALGGQTPIAPQAGAFWGAPPADSAPADSAVTFSRLADGTWGARGANLVAGKTCVVTRRDGTTDTITIGEIVATLADGSVTATITPKVRKSAGSRGRSRGKWSGCACGSRDDGPRDIDCASCKYDSF